MDELKEDIERIARRHGKLAGFNALASYCMSFLAIVGSVTASLCAALGVESKEWLAVLAVIPAAVLSIRGTFKFEERTSWHFRKHHKLEALARSLKYEGIDPAVVSAGWSKIEQELDEQWPQFGTPEGKSQSKPT